MRPDSLTYERLLEGVRLAREAALMNNLSPHAHPAPDIDAIEGECARVDESKLIGEVDQWGGITLSKEEQDEAIESGLRTLGCNKLIEDKTC